MAAQGLPLRGRQRTGWRRERKRLLQPPGERSKRVADASLFAVKSLTFISANAKDSRKPRACPATATVRAGV